MYISCVQINEIIFWVAKHMTWIKTKDFIMEMKELPK